MLSDNFIYEHLGWLFKSKDIILSDKIAQLLMFLCFVIKNEDHSMSGVGFILQIMSKLASYIDKVLLLFFENKED